MENEKMVGYGSSHKMVTMILMMKTLRGLNKKSRDEGKNG